MNDEEPGQPSGTQPVVACVEGSADGERALRFGIEEARRTGAPLRLVLVPPASPWFTGGAAAYTVPALRAVARETLDSLVAFCDELAPDVSVEGWLPFGTRVQAIVDESRQARCVVLGTRAREARHRYGSTTNGVAASSASPVIAVPPTWSPDAHVGRVVIGYDGSEAADVVLGTAFDAAGRRGAELVVVHAWRPDGHYERALAAKNEQVWQVGAERARTRPTPAARGIRPGTFRPRTRAGRRASGVLPTATLNDMETKTSKPIVIGFDGTP